MKDPVILFRAINVICVVIAAIIWIVTAAKYRTGVRVVGKVVGGGWKTTHTNYSTGQQTHYWFPAIEYLDFEGQVHSFEPTFGFRGPVELGYEIPLLLFPDGSVIANRFREKWIWVLIFGICAFFSSFAWFAR